MISETGYVSQVFIWQSFDILSVLFFSSSLTFFSLSPRRSRSLSRFPRFHSILFPHLHLFLLSISSPSLSSIFPSLSPPYFHPYPTPPITLPSPTPSLFASFSLPPSLPLPLPDAQPTEAETAVWNQVSAVLEEAHGILAELQSYNGAGQEIREVSGAHALSIQSAFNTNTLQLASTVLQTALMNDSHAPFRLKL